MESATPEAATVATARFLLVPGSALPAGRNVVVLEIEESDLRVLICETAPLADVCAELNLYAEHLIRHGLWGPQRGGITPPRMRHAS